MNAEEIGSLSQGNSALSEMGEHNAAIKEHNFRNRQQYQSLIQGAVVARKSRAKQEQTGAHQELALSGTGLGTGAVERGRGVYKAFKQAEAFEGDGWNTLGDGAKASRTLGQYAKGSETLQGLQKAGGVVQDLAEGANRLAEPLSKVAKAGGEIGGAVARSGVLGRGAQNTALMSRRASQLAGGGERALTSGEAVEEFAGAKGILGMSLPKISTDPLGDIAKAGEDTDAVARAAQAGADVEAGTGKLIEGLGKASTLAKGAGILSGGMSAIEDIASGHIVGHNKQEKAGNELGIASGILDVLSFVVPGAGLVGAALGVASGVESAVGASKEKEDKTAPKDIATGKTYSQEEQAGVEHQTTAAPSLSARGQIGVAPTNVVKSGRTGGTSGAF